MLSENAILNTSLPTLQLIGKGKVRDIYATSDPECLLFIATDRISAFDVILTNGIPEKGKILTDISIFWFKHLEEIVPNHFITAEFDGMPPDVHEYQKQLSGRCILVRKAQVIPLEAIVRGYITGSAWVEYMATGTVHGIQLPSGLIESQKLPTPLFTPSTKAEQGSHDENISPEKASEMVGQELYDLISTISLRLYNRAAEHLVARGVILADTKFEFGLLPETHDRTSIADRLILIDEVLTPDSSRYWPAESYEPGKSQPSFDKQFLRDWLKQEGFRKGLEGGPPGKEGQGWTMSPHVVKETLNRYERAREIVVS